MHNNGTTAAEPASLYDVHLLHLEALRRQRRAAATLKVYTLYCAGFVRFLQERGIECPTLEDLTPDLVGKYQDWVRGHSKGTRDGAQAERQAVTTLKIFARWLWRRSFFANDPLARVEAPRVKRLQREPFSKADCLALLEAALEGPDPVLERALLLLGLDTGCRIGELCATSVEDLNLEAGSILFRKTKSGRPRRVFFRVAGQPDGGPCVVSLTNWLAVRPKRADPDVRTLFVIRNGRPLTTEVARRIYRGLSESAGVPNAHPHRSRRTHATEFLTAMPGAELHLRHRIGHSSHEVLAEYITFSDVTARDVADVASVSAKWGL
jgi:integrase/recombinase XerD